MRLATFLATLVVVAGAYAQVSVRVPAHAELTITMQVSAFLNNTRDKVFLMNGGQTVQTVSYTSLEAKPGERIFFVVL